MVDLVGSVSLDFSFASGFDVNLRIVGLSVPVCTVVVSERQTSVHVARSSR